MRLLQGLGFILMPVLLVFLFIVTNKGIGAALAVSAGILVLGCMMASLFYGLDLLLELYMEHKDRRSK